jgi:hypothetical protein
MNDEAARQGRPASATSPPRSVAEALVDDVASFVRRFVVMSPHQADAVALWVAHTHALPKPDAVTEPAFEQSPYLAVMSPEKRCGKSRLFDVLELLIARPWRVISPSEAVLFRKVNVDRPTLLLDEVDAIFGSKDSNTEGLRALLNAGNRRGTRVPRCVGPQLKLKDFEVFSSKALAGIRDLPDTIADRAIPIRLKRRAPSEPIDRFNRRDVESEAHDLRDRIADWIEPQLDFLRTMRPDLPVELDDRAQDAWEPLLAIAELAGGNMPQRARAAAHALSGARDDDSHRVRLLADISGTFGSQGVDRISSADLVAELHELEDSPWPEWHGKPITKTGVASLLKHFEIRPRTVRLDNGTTAKGYRREQFEDAFSRYIPDLKCHNVTTRMDRGIEAESATSHVTDEKSRKLAWIDECDGVTFENAEQPPLLGKEAFAEPAERPDELEPNPSNENGVGEVNQDEMERLSELARHRVPLPGDADFLDFIATAHRNGHVTTAEALERERHHKLVERAREAQA